MAAVLVTGGTGFIGSHTVVELILAGKEVVIADNLSNSRIEVLDGIQQITGIRPLFYPFDLCDPDKVHELLDTHDFTTIIHFAASKAVGESVEKPLHYYRNNLFQLVNLLTAMKEIGVPNLVFSSSCTVYGQPDHLPVTEETPFKPAESPYGKTKQMGEEIIRDTCKADTTLKAISLRYFNPVGAHESALIGELPIGTPNNLVPFITQTAAGLQAELKVFGNDYPTPDGTAIRDYIHVTDLAKAHVTALERLEGNCQKTNYEYFNVGTGHGNSVLEAIQAFEKANGIKLKYKIVGRRPGDVVQVYADTSRANHELGWKAELKIEDMMRTAWKWQQFLQQHPEIKQTTGL